MGMGEAVRPILYTCAGSRGLRVSWAAQELGVALDYRMFAFPPRIHARSYLDVNPLGTVPALADGDHILTESVAITHYLASRSGPTPLVIDPGEQDYGAFLDFLHYADATATSPQAVYIRFVMFEPGLGLQKAGEVYAQWYADRLAKIENRLAGREYLCADRFTIADIAVTYALHLSTVIGLDHLLPAALKDYRARMIARPAFALAVAAEQAAATAQGVV